MKLTQIDACGRVKPEPVWVNFDNVLYIEPYNYREGHPSLKDEVREPRIGTRINFLKTDIVVKEHFDAVMSGLTASKK